MGRRMNIDEHGRFRNISWNEYPIEFVGFIISNGRMLFSGLVFFALLAIAIPTFLFVVADIYVCFWPPVMDYCCPCMVQEPPAIRAVFWLVSFMVLTFPLSFQIFSAIVMKNSWVDQEQYFWETVQKVFELFPRVVLPCVVLFVTVFAGTAIIAEFILSHDSVTLLIAWLFLMFPLPFFVLFVASCEGLNSRGSMRSLWMNFRAASSDILLPLKMYVPAVAFFLLILLSGICLDGHCNWSQAMGIHPGAEGGLYFPYYCLKMLEALLLLSCALFFTCPLISIMALAHKIRYQNLTVDELSGTKSKET